MLKNVSVITPEQTLSYLRACYLAKEYNKVLAMLGELYIEDGTNVALLIDKERLEDLCIYTLIRRHVFKKQSKKSRASCPNCGRTIHLPKTEEINSETVLKCLSCDFTGKYTSFE